MTDPETRAAGTPVPGADRRDEDAHGGSLAGLDEGTESGEGRPEHATDRVTQRPGKGSTESGDNAVPGASHGDFPG